MNHFTHHWLKIFFALFCFIIGYVPTQAQNAANYASSSQYSTNTTETLADMTGSTQLIGANQINTSSVVTAFGFEVWFMGQRYTNFSVNTNGVLQFGTSAISNLANTYAINTGEPRISPMSSGTQDGAEPDPITGSFTTSATGEVHYKLVGTYPNRRMVVEWRNMVMNHRSTTPLSTFQAHIYETPPRTGATTDGGRIYFVYGEMPTAFLDASNIGTSAQVQLGLGTGISLNDFLGFSLLGASPIPNTVDNDSKANSASHINSVGVGADVPLLHSTGVNDRRFINLEVDDFSDLPTDFRAICVTDTKIDLTWLNPASAVAVGAVIYRSTTSATATDFTFLAQIPIGTNIYSDTGLTPGTTYYYRIYMVNEGKLTTLGATASVTATTGATAIYSIASGNWNDPNIWDPVGVPTSTDDVVINCSDVVAISSDATCRNLQINPTSTLLFYDGGHTLAITGSFVNFGTFDMYGANANVQLAGDLTNNGGTWLTGRTSTFTLNGTTNQTLDNISSGTSYVTINDNTLVFDLAVPTIPDNAKNLDADCNPNLTNFSSGVAARGVNVGTPVSYTTITKINVSITHSNNEDLEIWLRNNSSINVDYYKLSTDNGGNGAGYNNVTFYDYATQTIDDFAGITQTFNNVNLRPSSCFTLRSIPVTTSNQTAVVFVNDDDNTINNLGGTFTDGSITYETRTSHNELAFHNLVINNSAGITANTNVRIAPGGSLTLTDGILDNGANEVIFMDNATASNGTNSSYIAGLARKIGDDAFTFPVGNDNFIANIGITAPASATDEFTAQYFHVDPTSTVYDPTSKDDINLTKISNCEYWILNRAIGTSNVSVTLSYQNTRSCGISDPTDLRVARWDGTSTRWENEGNGGTVAIAALSGIVTTAAVTTFSPFTLATQDPLGSPLPTQLLSFEISKDKNGVLARWQTLDDAQVAHYQLQRSTDGKQFTNSGQPIGIKDDNASVKQYITWDKETSSITAANLYYRLKIVYKDGAYAYSRIQELKMAREGYRIIHGAPNPFQTNINLSYVVPFAQAITVSIKDLMGQTVHTIKQNAQPGNNTLKIGQLERLPKGPYILTLQHQSGQLVRTIIKK